MARKNTTPFVFPGLGQFGDTAQNPLLASMEMMRTAWEGLAKAGGFDPALTAPGMSSDDLERRIADLRAVEQWLNMNLSMLASTIQTLEVQRSTVATLNAFVASATQGGAPTTSASPLDAVLGTHAARTAPSGDSSGLFGAPLGQVPPKGSPPSPQSGVAAGSPSADSASPADSGADDAVPTATQAAMQGWWDTLQTQFDNLAEATAATMKGAESMQEHIAAQASAAMEGSSPVAKKAASKKTAAKKVSARKATKTPSARKTASSQAGASKAAAKKAAKRTTSTSAAKKTAAKKTGVRKAAKSATGTQR